MIRKPLSITLVSVGNTKYPVDFKVLEKWKSDLFKISHGASVGHLPDAEGTNWDYPDRQLLRLIHPDEDADFTVGLINARLEDNYYLRRIDEKIAILSLYEMAEILRFFEFTLEQFILRNVYEVAVLFSANGKLIPENYVTWVHDEIRGCLFDMNASKTDIVFSLHRPILCPACRIKVSEKQVSADFLPLIDRELRQIQKSLYVRMSEWVKRHPILSLIVTAVAGIFLNIAANFIYDAVK